MWALLLLILLVRALDRDHQFDLSLQAGSGKPKKPEPKEDTNPCVLGEGVEAVVDCKDGQRLALNLLALHDPQTTLWEVKQMRQFLFPARYDIAQNWHKTTSHPTFLNLVHPPGVHPSDFIMDRIYFALVPPLVKVPLPSDAAWPQDPDKAIKRVGGFVWAYMHEDVNRAPVMIEMRAFVPPETKYASAVVMTKEAADPKVDTCKTWHPAIMPFFKGLSRCWQPHEEARGCFVYGNEVEVIVGGLHSPIAFQPRFRLCVGSPCG